jgi:hypothetical protein
MPLSVFDPEIQASERPQTHALKRATTGIGYSVNTKKNFVKKKFNYYVN